MYKNFLKHRKIRLFLFTTLFVVGFFALGGLVYASVTDDIANKSKQIEEIQRQIDEYQRQIDENRSKSGTLEAEIKKLNAQIGQLTLQIRSLEVSIDRAELEIDDAAAKIGIAEGKLAIHLQALGQYIKIVNANDQRTLTEVVLKNTTLSEFFGELNNIKLTQENLRTTINKISELKNDLEEQREGLESRREELEKLQRIQEFEKRGLDGEKAQKNKVLKDTKGQESKFQELVKKSTQDLNRLREQIYYLQQNGVSAEDAVKYGQLAAIRAGIRPAFLLAILEVESRLGQNIGSGNWRDDMYECYLRLSRIAKTAERKQYYINRAESEKNAFFIVTGKLGLDPNTVKVSKEPTYGCGGAMGPAQFIPTTWLGYEARIATLTGHNPPSPWSIEDAFMASAIKLANAGATGKTRASEGGAARAYIGGKTTCTSSICNSYSAAVLRKADEIEQNL